MKFFAFVDFGAVTTVWYFLFFSILELFRLWRFFVFSRFWSCSDSVVLYVFLDFGAVLTGWYFFVFLDFGAVPTGWYFFVFLDFGAVPTVWYFFLFF